MSVELYEGCYVATHFGGVFGPMVKGPYDTFSDARNADWSRYGEASSFDDSPLACLDAISVHATEAGARAAAIALHQKAMEARDD